MAIREIRIHPDPVLRARCAEVERFDEELRALAADMVETMHSAPGVGLAASQVGIELRLAVVDESGGEEEGQVRVLVNPVILEQQGREVGEEGCLSIPGLNEKVARPAAIRVAAQDLEGRRFELEAGGMLARIICHEVDHLDGILFIDRLTGLRRDRARRRLRRMQREQAAAL